MSLSRIETGFFELKHDGFSALAFANDGRCRSVSRNGNEFHKFNTVTSSLPKELNANAAVIDGEIVCLESKGRSQFNDLLFGTRRTVSMLSISCSAREKIFVMTDSTNASDN